MPPFGKRWFRVMRELNYGHPVAQLRLHWILLNTQEDRRLDAEHRRNDIEYGGFFANPEVYFKLKGVDKKTTSTTENPFGFAIDETEYWKKRDAAMRGKPLVKARRPDIAEMVRQKRTENERVPRRTIREREYQPSDGDDTFEGSPDLGIESDDLIVEG